ncbi:MAG: leucine-rich repeat domain-containing protein [Chitinispirillia bacterium]|nr:leucine-rich repeat domain-containing protein [Chitinispirillia bacterium]
MSEKLEGIPDDMQHMYEALPLQNKQFLTAAPPEMRVACLTSFYNAMQMLANSPPQAAAPAEETEGTIYSDSVWRYVLKDGKILMDGYQGSDTDIRIPAEVNGKTVNGIHRNAFHNLGLTGVTIPDTVTVIENGAFGNNKLTSVAIPAGVTEIGRSAFSGNQLASVDFGSCAASIGDKAFEDNKLTTVTIGDRVTSIGVNVFAGNPLTGVNIGKGITSIGERAFAKLPLASVVIPNNVTSIGESAFEDAQLTSVTFGSGVTSIGKCAFEGNQLTSVDIGGSIKSIEERAFEDNRLTSVSLGGGLQSIGERAFYNNQIVGAAMPKGVTIGDSAFANNKGEAESFKLVLSADAAFLTVTGGAEGVTDLRIPSRIQGMPVAVIAKGAFKGKQLTSVTLGDAIVTIEAEAFAKNRLAAVNIPGSVTKIGDRAFGENQITKVAMPDGVTAGRSVFAGNQGVAGDFEVTLSDDGEKITVIGYKGSATAVHIPEKIEGMPIDVIDNEAFEDKNLTAVTFDNGIAGIKAFAFSKNKLTEVIIPDSVTFIERLAFGDNPIKIASVPGSIEDDYLDDRAFDNGVKVTKRRS